MGIQTVSQALDYEGRGSPYGFKNRIINGAMVIDQRNAGASITPTDGQHCVDRFRLDVTQASKLTAQQNAGSVAVLNATGFANYFGITSSSSYSILSTDYFCIEQVLEGYNTSDFQWGTANAKTVTLSFWVYSSLTGTFGGAIKNPTLNTAIYSFTYTINLANTWEYKTITIPGPTIGSWSNTNTASIRLQLGLGVGSTYSKAPGSWNTTDAISATGAVSVVGTNGATFYITGVQLEKGSTATSFDYRPYGTELALCQRYFQKSYDIVTDKLGTTTTTGEVRWASGASAPGESAPTIMLPVVMRTTPTVTFYSANNGASGYVYNYSSATNTAMTGVNVAGSRGWSGGTTAFTAGNIIGYHFAATAEL
jgi:hypothetical protein